MKIFRAEHSRGSFANSSELSISPDDREIRSDTVARSAGRGSERKSLSRKSAGDRARAKRRKIRQRLKRGIPFDAVKANTAGETASIDKW